MLKNESAWNCSKLVPNHSARNLESNATWITSNQHHILKLLHSEVLAKWLKNSNSRVDWVDFTIDIMLMSTCWLGIWQTVGHIPARHVENSYWGRCCNFIGWFGLKSANGEAPCGPVRGCHVALYDWKKIYISGPMPSARFDSSTWHNTTSCSTSKPNDGSYQPYDLGFI